MYDCITIGDAMRDIFLFPSLLEMEKPVTDQTIHGKDHFNEYLVFGLGDKITISDASYAIGGTAANAGVGLSRLGLKVAIITGLGADNVGGEIKDNLEDEKIETNFIKIYQNKKSSFSVIVSYKGERTIFVYHAFSPENFHLPQSLDTNWLYLGPMAEGYERLYNRITSEVIAREIKIAVNPGPVQIKAGLNSFGGLLKLISVIFLNREEAIALSGLRGIPKVKDLAKVIQLQGPQIVIITDGKDGAYVYNGIDFFRVGAYPGHRLDSTGAGDSFAAAFLAAMIDGQSLRDCLKWGAINSASVIEKIGAQEGLLSKNTIKRRVKEYRWPADTLRFS